MAHIAYYRVSTGDQSIEAQQHALLTELGLGRFEKEFRDVGVSGSIQAADRPGFAALLSFVREGDVLYVYAVDRLGRDALDVQTTVRLLLRRGIVVFVRGLGQIGPGVGELILAVLAQVADMERQRIVERTAHGRAKARQSIAETGRTHRGKTSLGRPVGRINGRDIDPQAVASWRTVNAASISETASHWQISAATVKRYCGRLPDPAAGASAKGSTNQKRNDR